MNPEAIIRRHSIRQPGAFVHALEKASQWINLNLHPSRIISISTTLCNYNGDCMINIYYNEGKTDDAKNPNLVVRHHIVRDSMSWINHFKEVDAKAHELHSKVGKVIAVNDLETPAPKFEDCLTVIWYEREK